MVYPSLKIIQTCDLKACHDLRMRVFVDEQNVPVAEEIDDLDDVSTHFLAYDNDAPIGTARIFEQGEIGKIGRVCVLKSHRGLGIGKALIEACLEELASRSQLTTAKLGSQDHAVSFYAELGFEKKGEAYMDAGIKHFNMIKPLKS